MRLVNCAIFLGDILGRGSKTVILVYDTWANLHPIMCICGYLGVFACIWVYCWIFQIRFVDLFLYIFFFWGVGGILGRGSLGLQKCMIHGCQGGFSDDSSFSQW